MAIALFAPPALALTRIILNRLLNALAGVNDTLIVRDNAFDFGKRGSIPFNKIEYCKVESFKSKLRHILIFRFRLKDESFKHEIRLRRPTSARIRDMDFARFRFDAVNAARPGTPSKSGRT